MRGACLIAGCGDTGIRIANLLVKQGQKVYGLRRIATALPANIIPIAADLTDPATLDSLPADIETLVYLPTPPQRTHDAYQKIFRDGFEHLLRALPQAATTLRRIVFISSSAVYGQHHGAWVDEETECRPLAFNGEILLSTEQWLLQNFTNACVLRFAGIYGPGRIRLIEDIGAQKVRVHAGAARYTNRIHVDDAAAAVMHVLGLQQVRPIYNVVDDLPAADGEVYDWLADKLGAVRPAREDKTSSDTLGNKRVSNKRLRASGFAPRYADYRAGYGAVIDTLAPIKPNGSSCG
ncbi:SDR family oxidoreductase [Pseudolysobacter antarcticus]|uniref:SDR family oxidoreductase n=1 Tax=Pseudolysobacter antarcticus TaxID=2511995 RepID=A0A411HQG5_9GAMM|nr:SDR family oxidoreductase [Pseudolysobacter antarcticus]